jgi:hypothetical protein
MELWMGDSIIDGGEIHIGGGVDLDKFW